MSIVLPVIVLGFLFTALDALRKLDLEDAPPTPDTRKDTP